MKRTSILFIGLALIWGSKLAAAPVTVTITSGGVNLDGPIFYSVTGEIVGDLSGSTFTVTGGLLSLTGSGPDTEMTINPGVFSYDSTPGLIPNFWDFGQGPFDIGVTPANPHYVLNNTGFSGTLSDVFGSIVVGGSFDAEGWGQNIYTTTPDHIMSSFFWSGTAAGAEPQPVPEPTTLILLGTGLLGLIGYGYRRRDG